MNINKTTKRFLPALMIASTTLFITGCDLFDSDDDPALPPALAQCEDGIDNDADGLTDFPADPGCIDALDNDETDPPPVPTDGITGIWTGSFAWSTTGQQKDYKVTMLFHTPDGAAEGITGGPAFGAGPVDPDEPHFLFEGGYAYSADPIESDPLKDNSIIACDGDVWAVGRFGTHGTFVQEFSYVTGSAAGPEQRGAGCLYLTDADGDGYVNELTGDMQFEDAGKFTVNLTYSTENTRDVTVSDLGTLATDDIVYHLWSNDNSGTSMSYTSGAATADTINIAVVESHLTATCGGDVKVTKVADHNLFALATITDVAGCTVLLPGTPLPTGGSAQDVDLPYFGLGALFDLDGDGKLEFIHLMASQGGATTAQALYNEFDIQ